ncbi:aldehyde dehydrogenase family protein [Frankia sp. AgPm24]|uniref:aldehyde dehydrogenase family protein n=1 Tax=Frankia sp. AgPm24 TaxID=631128 RepID=UPI00200F2BA0|nr:aldehyde dehydrogenase family protein [Frankia sp. AgPm24]MCK9922980.1 aldehyde dehydrogenase family protein [Frankia sp. AgPm24]
MALIPQTSSYVAGKWIDSGDAFAVENPADESRVTDVVSAPAAEFERAIVAARQSFDSGVWADLVPRERARILNVFLDAIVATRAELADTIIAEAGLPRFFTEGIQVDGSITLGRETLDLYLALPEEDFNPVPVNQLVAGGAKLSVRRYEPVGVVSAITPYNAAIIMGIQKIIPALAAGNSVVLRPSPLTPISSLVFGAAAEAAGLPPGVLSVLIESGAAGAELMTTHPAVDLVSFTGSTAVGKAILAQAASTVKHVALELGGKSAQIYLPDAVDAAARGGAAVVAATAGQACVAATRMFVPADRKAEVVAAVSATYQHLKVGDPAVAGTMIGPVISAGQRERCERFVALAQEHGATVATGGRRPEGLERGYYFEPTVLDLPDNTNPAAQEEIFGPVLGIIGYTDVDEAVRMANDSIYGLSGQVYGADVAAATAVARRIRAGAVNVNANGGLNAYAPSGGYKQSGLGRERGPDGIRAFQEIKNLTVGSLG